MEKEDFWKSIKASSIKMPADILEEYATTFNKRFGNFVVLETRGSREIIDDWAKDLNRALGVDDTEPNYIITMRLLAPSIKDYSLPIIKIRFQISNPYPCSLFNLMNQEQTLVECNDSDQLDKAIYAMLSEDGFIQKLSIILAQVGFREV